MPFCMALMALAGAALFGTVDVAVAATWRIGDVDQPWRLHPVSFELDGSPAVYKPDYLWGGAYAVEIVVDDDGDGLIDEDPVDRVDDDGDGFFNEDPDDGLDNDLDGLVDEDGADPQRDGDGDGLINEDGLMTGGPLASAALQGEPPWSTREVPGEFGDDDGDASVNEYPSNGRDDDGDGLIDEDDRAAGIPRSGTWQRSVFEYDVSEVGDVEQRRQLRFEFDGGSGTFKAALAQGDTVEARLRRMQFTPSDWIRPIRLDSTRNLAALSEDRFLNGQFARSPIETSPYTGTYRASAVRAGDRHIGMALDRNPATARFEPGGGDLLQRYMNIEFRGLFLIDRVRLYPRPQFPNRVLSHFKTFYAGDDPGDIFVLRRGDTVVESLNPRRFLLPEQVDQKLPIVKDFRLDGGELGPPQRARVVSIQTTLPTVAEAYYATAAWEVAELEIYGSGHAMDASYVSEIIDVGTSQVRRYFDAGGNSVPFESVLGDGDAQRRSFDPDRRGQPVTWGRVRWKAQVEGRDASASVRVRAGTAPDTRVYERQIASGIVSAVDEDGEPLDVVGYLSLAQPDRVPVQLLPYNRLRNDADGQPVGWTPWSAPLDFRSGLVDEDGEGGVEIPVSLLSRYIQFRLDFRNDETGGVALDYLEFDYDEPRVNGSVLAEIWPGTAIPGSSSAFEYAIKPTFAEGGDGGFDRIDIAVPSLEAEIDSVVVDGLAWQRLQPQEPRLQLEKAWLDSLRSVADQAFAGAVYADSSGRVTMGIKTRRLQREDFALGQDIRVHFRTPVYQLFTQFRGWIWDDDQVEAGRQPMQAGNAADFLPTDEVSVVARTMPRIAELTGVQRVLTPNADGVNDTGVFEVTLYLLDAPVEVTIDIRDLSGALVGRLGPASLRAGRHEFAWDGLDPNGFLVPPGLYLYTLKVDSDARSHESTGSMAVAY